MKSDKNVDTATSPWRQAEGSGDMLCHYCGHHFELDQRMIKQHFQGCVWLVAYLKESNVNKDGPQLLTE